MIHAARYISDRFLPDQAIDLDDKAALSLCLAQESKSTLEQLDQAAMTVQIELQSLRNQSDRLRAERRGALEQALERPRKKAAALEELVRRIFLLQKIYLMCEQSASGYSIRRNASACFEDAKHQLEAAQRNSGYEAASGLRHATIPKLQHVTSDDIARLTGIPVLKGERERLVHVHDFLSNLLFFNAVGRWGAHCKLALSVKTTSSARTMTLCAIHGLSCRRPTRPVASFLFISDA